MKASALVPSLLCLLLALLAAPASRGQDAAPVSNLPEDPFAGVEAPLKAAPYSMELDRTRGSFSVEAENGTYSPGSHFGVWRWTTKAERWGRYLVTLRYTSSLPKLGIQVKVGDAVVKSYAPRTGGHEIHREYGIPMGYLYIEKPGEYPVSLLTGDSSNGPSFFVKGIDFVPAPESDTAGQAIDGTIELPAKAATTFARHMRFEPAAEKDCLGYWTDAEDWAEWEFQVSSPGKFRVELVQGCGEGQGGSEVALLINDHTITFEVEDTGGFQNWKNRQLGVVEIPHAGTHRIALKPLKLAGKAVMDVKKVILVPLAES